MPSNSKLILALAVSLAAAACKNNSSSTKADDGGRALIGRAAPFQVSVVDNDKLDHDFVARRQFGWETLQKVMAPVAVTIAGQQSTMPTILSWYEIREFIGVATQLYKDKGAKLGSQAGFAAGDIEAAFATAFAPRPARLNAGYFNPTDKLSSPAGGAPFHVLSPGTINMELFSEGILRHYLLNAQKIADCGLPDPSLDLVSAKAKGLTKSWSSCMETEFPADAVITKLGWQPVDAQGNVTLNAYATDADSLTCVYDTAACLANHGIASDVIQSKVKTLKADPASMFIVKARDGKSWVLTNLHVATKETDNWVWTTFWWSDTPSTDFGADRPKVLQPSLINYKMAIQTNFLEQDANPTKNITDASLQKAVLAISGPNSRLRTPHGVATMAANPFSEGTFPNGTCMGCHQGAGRDPFSLGRDELDKNRPGDFTQAFETFAFNLRTVRSTILGVPLPDQGDLPPPQPLPTLPGASNSAGTQAAPTAVSSGSL